METLIEPIIEITEISQLLSSCELPVSDIEASESLILFGCRKSSDLTCVIGLELYETVALLRSLAVSPSSRTYGLGSELVTFAEEYAQSIGKLITI